MIGSARKLLQGSIKLMLLLFLKKRIFKPGSHGVVSILYEGLYDHDYDYDLEVHYDYDYCAYDAV